MAGVSSRWRRGAGLGGAGGEGGAPRILRSLRRSSGAVVPSGLADPATRSPGTSLLATRPPPEGTATGLVGNDGAVGRLVPSGVRFGSGGASPSAWRFQELGSYQVRGLESSMPKQSLSRVMWGLDGASSDDCAPLAASAVRLGLVRRPFLLVFRHCLRASLPPRLVNSFPCNFRGLFLTLRVGLNLSTPEGCAHLASRARGFRGLFSARRK